eukprot:106235_1
MDTHPYSITASSHSNLSFFGSTAYGFNAILIIWSPVITLNILLAILSVITIPIRFIVNTIIGKRNVNALIMRLFRQTQSFNTEINNEDDANDGNSNTLCIVTWNLYAFCDRFWLRQSLILQELMSHNPEILCCQEAISSTFWSKLCTMT